MITDLFAVFDAKTRAFGKPFHAENMGTAVRHFRYAANDKNCDIGKYPEDFTLYHLGAYDDSNARIDLQQVPIEIAQALGLVEVK